jgi:hypothetical protein
MAYGGAGLCPDFVLRAKKCKITAKIGKKLEKILRAVKLYHGPNILNTSTYYSYKIYDQSIEVLIAELALLVRSNQ